jgi:hypothetical protein
VSISSRGILCSVVPSLSRQSLVMDILARWEGVFLGSGLSCLIEISAHCGFV